MEQNHHARLQTALNAANAEIARLRAQCRDNQRMLEELRESEANLRTLFHSVHDAVFICTPDETVIDLNDQAVEMFGMSREQLLAANLRKDLIRPRSPLDKLDEIWPKLLKGEVSVFQWVAQRPEKGKLFPVEIILRKTLWDRQDVLLVTIQDITHSRQIKNLLRRRRKLLAVILDGNPIATFVIDTAHRVIFWNKACEILTGVPKSQCLGKPVDSRIFYSGVSRPVLADLVLDMDREKIQELYRDKNIAASSFIPEAFEASDRLTISGVQRFIYFLAARCRDEHGEIVGAIETIQDFSERDRAEAALRASKRLLMEVTANIPGVVYQYQALGPGRMQGRFTFISDGLRKLFGLAPEKVMQDPELLFSRIAPNVRDRFATSLTCDTSPGSLVEFEFSMEAAEDAGVGARWFKNSSQATAATDGTVSWNGVLTDITEIKRTEMLRSDVERMIRHDLKSPLTGIGGLARLLLRENLPDRQREIAATIYQSAMKLLHMIGHSMALFQMEEGTYKLQPREFDLIKMLHALHEEFQPSARAKSLEIAYLLDDRPMSRDDQRLISGEDILLESLFANLIQNAVDAAPEGTRITVAVRIRGRFHEIDIHNHGVIPEKIRQNFFDRYVTCGKDHGTGIGTYSAMLIAKTHQGSIRFTTSEEDGTHLIVSLPKTYPA